MSASVAHATLGPVRCGPPISILGPEDHLHSEVWFGDVQKVDELIRIKGIPIEALNGYGQTPLFVCCYCDDREMAKALLSLGADPNTRCVGGYTAVHGACWSGAKRILRRLLDAGADLDITDCWRMTPVDWVYEQADPEKQNKVFELLESVRRWTLNSSAVSQDSEERNHMHRRPKLQRSRSTLATSDHNHLLLERYHAPNRHFNGIKSMVVKNNHNQTAKDVIDGSRSPSKMIKDISINGSIRRWNPVDNLLTKHHIESARKMEEKRKVDDVDFAQHFCTSDKLRRGAAQSSGAIGGADRPDRAVLRETSVVGYRAVGTGSRINPLWSKSQPGLHCEQSILPSYPTRYRLKCQMIENNGGSVSRVNIAGKGRNSGSEEKKDCDSVSKPADFVASADHFVRWKSTCGFQKSESNLPRGAEHRSGRLQQQQLYCLRRYENPDTEKVSPCPDGKKIALRISESIQERQHQLLSATNSDPVRTRTCDAPSVPASRHPQFAMPMSKPVLLRAQNNKHASMVEPTVTQQKLQQPRRLEKELAFGEVQWTQVPNNSHPPLTTSTPNEPPAIRSQRFLARQCGQCSFKFPPAAASGIDVRKQIAATNTFNGSFNSVLPPSEETSVVVGRHEVSEAAQACGHDDGAFQEQQCDAAATIYETLETGGEWASNDDADGDKWPQEEHGEVNVRNANKGDFETNTAGEECESVAWIDEPEPDVKHCTISQVEGENLEQECVAGEEAWNSVLTGDNAVARMGNNTVEQIEAAATIHETLENGDEWASNNDGDGHKWPQEEHGNAEGDFEADDAVEECGSVAWIDEPEPDAKQGSFSQVGGENLEEGCGVEEGAWSSVLVENDNALKSPGTSTIEWAVDDPEKIPETQETGETEIAEQEELRGTMATSTMEEDVEDIYVDDDDLNESNPNMMLTRRASVTDDEDGIGEMIGFPRVPVLPDHESILSMDIPSTGPTSLRSNCTDPTDTEDDDEVGGDSGTGGVSNHEDKSTVSAKAVTTAASKKKADTFAQLTSKEELSQAKLILINDRA